MQGGAFRSFIDTEMKKYEQIVKDTGVTASQWRTRRRRYRIDSAAEPIALAMVRPTSSVLVSQVPPQRCTLAAPRAASVTARRS